jgi:hypothetical protein
MASGVIRPLDEAYASESRIVAEAHTSIEVTVAVAELPQIWRPDGVNLDDQ